jgi:hypothetical protein
MGINHLGNFFLLLPAFLLGSYFLGHCPAAEHVECCCHLLPSVCVCVCVCVCVSVMLSVGG